MGGSVLPPEETERVLLAQDDRESALAALAEVDVWAALGEVFAARLPDSAQESISLTVRHFQGDERENSVTLALCSTFADALAGHRPQAEAFLGEWLPTASEVDGYDLAFKVPAQCVGTALAALVRSGELPARFHPMIKPYHRFPEYSKVPLPLLRELEERSLTT